MPKPRKVEEAAGTYKARPRTKAKDDAGTALRRVDAKTFRESTDKVVVSRRDLLRRLAQ